METITVSTNVKAPIARVWEFWTRPEHIVHWCHASDDWHAPHAENDLRDGGRFVTRMEARDGSAGFDFGGTYTEVTKENRIAYIIDDARKVTVLFDETEDGGVRITETFEPETINPISRQREGWQSILDSFRTYAEKEAA